MIRTLSLALCLAFLPASARAFFVPMTIEQKVAGSSVIAVVKVTKIHRDSFTEAIIVNGLLGAKVQEKIKIWNDVRIDKDGTRHATSGRDPFLEEGKTYLIYLNLNPQGKLVTVQSSLDAMEVTAKGIEKGGSGEFEPLERHLEKIRGLIEQAKKPGPPK